jgi:carbon monoxide dehydrogenase subunit G
MDISGEHRIPAPRQKVWEALNNAEILKQCITGCKSLEQRSDTEFKGTVAAKVGPVSATFTGDVTLSDLDPPKGYTLSGKGQGGAAGFANGEVKVNLEEDGNDTILTYQADARIGGKLAQLGARLVEGTVKKMASEFFTKFSEIISQGGGGEVAPQQPAESAELAEPTSRGLSSAIWAIGLITIVGLLLWIFTQ